MAPSRQLQNWNEEGLAWRIATAFAEHTRKDDWPAIMGTLKTQGCQFTESALRYVAAASEASYALSHSLPSRHLHPKHHNTKLRIRGRHYLFHFT